MNYVDTGTMVPAQFTRVLWVVGQLIELHSARTGIRAGGEDDQSLGSVFTREL